MWEIVVIGVQQSGKIRSRTKLPAGLVTGFDISKKLPLERMWASLKVQKYYKVASTIYTE